MDLLEIQKALDKISRETLPQVDAMLKDNLREAINDGHDLLDRLNGTKLKLTEGGFILEIPLRKVQI